MSDAIRAAGQVVDGLKGQPLALALVVINVLFLGAALWLFHETGATAIADRDHRNKMEQHLMTSCANTVRDDIDETRMELRGLLELLRMDFLALKQKG